MNTVLYIFLIFYIVVIILTAHKLSDIIKNPEKYREDDMDRLADERIKKKKHFGFFQSLSHQYAFVPLFMSFAFSGIGALIIRLIIKLVAGDNNLIIPDTWIISGLALLFINFSFGMVIVPMHIKNSFFAVAMDDILGSSRYRTWKQGYIWFLVSFVLLFPFCGFSANNYLYYDVDGITSSRYFELGETYTAYEDIETVKIYYYYDDDNELCLEYRVLLSDGKMFDMTPTNFCNEDTYNLHRMIEQKAKCEPEVMPLTDEEILYMRKTLTDERIEWIEYIFEGFHH